nr:hypothetical protein [Candidatus Gracilibacteria bacterium]
MNLLKNIDIPKDYKYYRSHSKVYFSWILKNFSKKTIKIEENGNYGYINHFFGGLFSIACFEKVNVIPTYEMMKKYKMKRGLIFWSGWSQDKPYLDTKLIWLKLGYLFSWGYHHSVKSSFSVLDQKEYWKKWERNARGHRNKIRKELDSGVIKINTNAKIDDFINIYVNTKVKHNLKRYLINRQKFLSEVGENNIRIYLAYIESIPLAGAIFLDDSPTSTYLVAFQNDKGKKHNLGLALIDKWFEESEKLGFKYLDLDHMRGFLDPNSYKGYTKFKSSIADYELSFPNVWLGIIF